MKIEIIETISIEDGYMVLIDGEAVQNENNNFITYVFTKEEAKKVALDHIANL